MTKPTFARIGVVSEGTLRDEDLISAFAGELDYYMKRLRLTRDQRKRFATLVRDANSQAEVLESDRDFEHDHYDAGGIINELEDALNEIAPPYCYFGTPDGDGACFGFFPCLGMGGDTDDLPKLDDLADITREHWGEDVLIVNDHGNVTCGHVDRRGRFKAYWAVV